MQEVPESAAVYLVSDLSLSFTESFSGLSALNLQIQSGESFGIIGPSGEGKSVLLKILAGLLEPHSGRVLYGGQDLYSLSKKDRMEALRTLSMTFQRAGLFDSLTALQNVLFAFREKFPERRAEAMDRAEEELRAVDLWDARDKVPEQMSGGMQKRLMIARSMVLSPKVMLYDDPMAGLDPVTSRQVGELILSAKARHSMTVVFVTSEVAQAQVLCDRIGFLYRGKFQDIRPAKEIAESMDPTVRQFVLGLLEGPLTEIYDQV